MPVRKIALSFFIAISCLGLADSASESEEALFARRIAEFWKDNDTALTKSQIEQFFQLYPSSPYQETLLILLGDIYRQEKNYGRALSYYNQLYTPVEKEKAARARLECLYHLGLIDQVKEELKNQLPDEEKAFEGEEQASKGIFYAELLLKEGGEDNYKAANRLYTKLLKTEYKGEALLALAEIALQNKAFVDAAHFYEDASVVIPDKQKELLLVALQLLYQEGKFTEILNKKGLYKKGLKRESDPWLGKSYFALGQYGEALLLLLPSINIGDKQSLLTILSAAYQVEDYQLADKVATQFTINYPNDEGLPAVLYLQAMSLKYTQNKKDAERLLRRLQKEFPKFENHEEVSYELAAVLFEQQKWDESHAQFLHFIKQYPSSIWYPYALYYLPEAAYQGEESFGDLLSDIDRFLLLSESDQEKGLTLAKIAFGLYDKKKYSESETVARKIIILKPANQLLAQVHFLLAACALETGKDPQQFIEHAEKVLELRPDFPGKERLREKLVNSYLQAKEKDAAARHLYITLEEKGEIPQETTLWLANYFYEKTQEKVPETFYGTIQDREALQCISKGILAFEAVLGSDPAISPDNLKLEQEYFKLSNLYAWRGQHEAQVVLLQNLHEQQRKNPGWQWSLPTRTLIALAEGYRALNDKEKALQAYAEIMHSRTADTSSLYRAKLEWVRLHDEELSLDDPLAIEMLKHLKDLQIKKTVKYEPLHLEAALEYARLRSSLSPPESRKDQYYFLLQRVKEDFTEKKDLISKEYHAEREKLVSQNQIYQAYMMLIDAHLFRYEGEMDPLKKQTAASLYKSLLKGKFAVSKYLIDQAKSGLDALN